MKKHTERLITLALISWLLIGCGDDGGSGGGAAAKKPDPKKTAAEFITRVESQHDVKTGAGAWAAAAALRTQASAWREDGKSQAANELLNRAARLKVDTLALDPNFEPARTARGERRYADELLPLIEADWLEDVDRSDAEEAHKRIVRATKDSHGWATEDRFRQMDALLVKLKPKIDARKELEASPFYKAAQDVKESTLADLDKRFGDWDKWSGAEMKIQKPFVFFIQKDSSWDPVSVASSRARELFALQDIIMAEFKDDLDLKQVEEPVPVLMFRSHEVYKKYAGEASTAYAHFEPGTGRLAVHDDCSHTTIMHEGTHQLMWFWSKGNSSGVLSAARRAYWFNEGIAEWYSGAARRRNADNTGWTYEIGLLHNGRIQGLSRYMSKGDSKQLFNLKELIQTRYAHRAKIRRTHREGHIYSQGWFLIYFLNHYNVDGDGNVVLGKPGKYAARWRNYVKGELEGQTGYEEFMKAMGLDEAGLSAMEDEYWRYGKWINKKILLRAVEDKRVLPWQEQKAGGRVVGRAKDDILPEVAPEERPPMGRDTIGGGDVVK